MNKKYEKDYHEKEITKLRITKNIKFDLNMNKDL